MGKKGLYRKIVAVFIMGLIVGAAVPDSVMAHKSGTTQDKERMIGGYVISELEKELGAVVYGHDRYENEDYILVIFHVEKPKTYPEVSKVKLVLYDKNNDCFSDNHEQAFELHRDWYLKEHRMEINEQMVTVIEEEGFNAAITSLDDWTFEHGEPSTINIALEHVGLKAGAEGLGKLLEKPLGTLSNFMGILADIIIAIKILELPITLDHVESDLQSAQATELQRISKLSDTVIAYGKNPSEDLRDEILDIENWEIGTYKDYYIEPKWPLDPKAWWECEETRGLTWEHVFTYRDNKRAEGWFADATEVNLFYATVANFEVWEADEAKNKAMQKMDDFVDNPTQENYREAWITLVESADLIRISYIFKSMVHSQWAHYAGTEHYLHYEPSKTSRILLPYPYSSSLYDVQGYYYNDLPAGAGYFAKGSWEDIPWPFDENDVYDAIDASKNANYWKETSYGIIKNYLLFSGRLADKTELFVPGEENKPDLIVTSITWSPEKPEEGDEVTFSYTIENQRAGKAGTSKTALIIDGEKVCEDDVYSLNPSSNSMETFRCKWEATAGGHEIRVVADYYGTVEESKDGNNEMRKMLLTGEGEITKIIDELVAWWDENKDELFEALHELIEAILVFIDELITEYEKDK